MTGGIQHDPRTKQQIKDAIHDYLYELPFKRLNDRLNTIIYKNCLIIGSQSQCFSYKGVVYSGPNAVPSLKKDRLSLQLQVEMNEYLKDVQTLNSYEMPYVLGFISQVLNTSNDLQDHLRVLPDAVHQPILNMINSCPCRTTRLSNEVVAELQQKNKLSIDLIKQRLVTNLLI